MPRAGDIVVATYPNCGTTWMQRIVNLLVFQSTEPAPLAKISPWIDIRIQRPVEEVIADIDAQQHRRAVKTHLPFDGIPVFDEVQYIHVARDGRDACLSYHNHGTGFTDAMLADLDKAGLADETIGKIYPRIPVEPAVYFRKWLSESAVPGQSDGYQYMSFVGLELTYWTERRRGNLLLVHYRDMKADLEGEMRRVAAFLGIDVAASVWPELISAAGFETMKRQGDALRPNAAKMLLGGNDRFFNKGQNDRWKALFDPHDLAAYDAKLAATLPPACIRWLEGGRAAVSDPVTSLD